MAISTRLTELLRVEHPIMLAPMDIVADGKLAATVTAAGGFGIIGGGHGQESWLTRGLGAAGRAPSRGGFLPWGIGRQSRPPGHWPGARAPALHLAVRPRETRPRKNK